MARVVEGTFNVRDAVLELVEGPAWTRGALQRLQAATEKAQSLLEEDPDAAAEVLAASAPSLRQKVWAAAGSGQLANFLSALGIAVAVILGAASLDSLTAEEVEKIVERALEQDEK